MKVKSFFDDEFKLFSIYDNVRSIPSVIDGLKVSQRKTVYAMLKRGESADEIKVENAGNYVASVTDYHHGAVSLFGTIVGLAQNFTGSNNINLLSPEGQFGSILNPEAGAPRYIFTKMDSNFRKIFKKEDDLILQSQYSDGIEIEPELYYPIIPMILVNGAKGTGTGYACNILSYNPDDIKDMLLSLLSDKKYKKQLVPWFKNFKGKITKDVNQIIIEGVYNKVDSNTIEITELPIGTYQDDFRALLNKLEDEGFIKSFQDSSTEQGFNFLIDAPRSTVSLGHEAIMKKFNLIRRVTETFALWTENQKMKVFNSPEEIVSYFLNYRLNIYEVRRLMQIQSYQEDVVWINEKLNFIKYYIQNSQNFAQKNKKEIEELLRQQNFVEIDKLLQIKIYSLSKDEIDKLENDKVRIETLIKELEDTDNKSMYIKELQALKF